MRAGLIAALKCGEPLADGIRPPDGSQRWPVHIITPTAHPLEALAASLAQDSEPVKATIALTDELARDSHSLLNPCDIIHGILLCRKCLVRKGKRILAILNLLRIRLTLQLLELFCCL